RGVEVYGHKGPKDASFLATAAFNIKGLLPSDVGYELNRRSMYVRIGLHCAPMAHQTVGTFPNGSLRASPGYFTQEDDIRAFIEAVSEIAEG
ncbi:MAG TPA: aminotransferase class V-fold PLP-dependent enzyme, partial [Syntrophorhabdaceae bacterium]|nr:aminotransferase class V-fold PLP-dependent enzyme [Syntrophorhabdaceae bacterium]